MNKELTDKLYSEFPELFHEHTWPVSHSAMPWGLQCQDGWYGIIEAMCRLLCWKTEQAAVSWSWINDDNDPRWTLALQHFDKVQSQVPKFSCIKEKLATLRIYHYSCDPYFNGVIDMTMSASASICEDCGSPGSLRDSGWLFTHCDGCHEKQQQSKMQLPASVVPL